MTTTILWTQSFKKCFDILPDNQDFHTIIKRRCFPQSYCLATKCPTTHKNKILFAYSCSILPTTYVFLLSGRRVWKIKANTLAAWNHVSLWLGGTYMRTLSVPFQLLRKLRMLLWKTAIKDWWHTKLLNKCLPYPEGRLDQVSTAESCDCYRWTSRLRHQLQQTWEPKKYRYSISATN